VRGMLSLIPGFTVALSLSSARLTPVVASATSVAYDITKVKGDDASLKRAAAFFVNGFWVASTTSGDAALNEKGMEQLCRLQTDDMVGRYGDLVGTRRLESSLFLAQDPSSGELAGCVGVEMALVDASCGKVLSRAQGESLFNSELASMSPKERNSYRKMDAYDLTDELFPEYKCVALLANLAVAPSSRGSGLGRRLCERVEEVADVDWDLPAIMLQVEEANSPARKLYAAMGYQDVYKDEAASALRVQAGRSGDELLKSEASTLVLMGKGFAAPEQPAARLAV